MSLMSYLNFDNSSTSSNAASSLGSAYTTALQQLTAAQATLAAGTTTSNTSTGSGVTISANASVAAATKADAKKDAAMLVTDIRTDLDAQYVKNGKGKAELSAMSPRAVATIALNSNGDFSKAEVLAARQEMRARDRAAFFAVTANDFSLSSLQTYQNARLNDYKSMSVEERAVRGAKG